MSAAPFDQRDGWIWYDGQLVPWRDAKLHVLSHALHYASSVFEGERAYEGVIFKSTEHSERLRKSAEILDFEIPYSVEEIDAAKNLVLERNGQKDAYVRPVAWRGAEMMGVSAQNSRIHLAIATWEWPSYFDPAQKMKGIRLDMAEYRRPDPATAPSAAKAAGLYMICTISKHKAERKGYADALMLDWQGRVAECTGANVFFIRDGTIHTPIADCFLDGITRRTVIDLARGRGFEVQERRIMPDELDELQRVLHHRDRRRGDSGLRDRPLSLPARQHDQGADGGLFGRGAAEGQGGLSGFDSPDRRSAANLPGPGTILAGPIPARDRSIERNRNMHPVAIRAGLLWIAGTDCGRDASFRNGTRSGRGVLLREHLENIRSTRWRSEPRMRPRSRARPKQRGRHKDPLRDRKSQGQPRSGLESDQGSGRLGDRP